MFIFFISKLKCGREHRFYMKMSILKDSVFSSVCFITINILQILFWKFNKRKKKPPADALKCDVLFSAGWCWHVHGFPCFRRTAQNVRTMFFYCRSKIDIKEQVNNSANLGKFYKRKILQLQQLKLEQVNVSVLKKLRQNT